ncbi:MAG: hypothetical protein ACR2JM_00150 [Mycobacterium sp.]
MNITATVVLISLALVYAAAIGTGLLIHRVHVRRADVADPNEPLGGDGLGGAVGYIGSAAAFLLGVLMLASLDHYNATKSIVANEALNYSAAFESTDELPTADQQKIQHDLVCLMRSVATNSWAAAASEDLTGSDNTHAWRRVASADAKAVIPRSKAEEGSLNSLQSALIEASNSGQQRLLAAEEDLPLALWILLFLSIFALVSILTALLRAHASRTLAITALTAVLILTTAMVWTLTMFDRPFYQGDGVYISPRALNAVMIRLEGTYPGAAWGPCELLADP